MPCWETLCLVDTLSLHGDEGHYRLAKQTAAPEGVSAHPNKLDEVYPLEGNPLHPVCQSYSSGGTNREAYEAVYGLVT